ncbi:MAG: hypothetical protein ETSY1_40800 [Candidatus Entotheonella factor]|uniref:Uncharacterized protein n=1 Tax=Entotheonella factor TaxID=1429438 RepID=W4L5B2_ENTF1|nr:MAG: hypothetical protein ETSY1_40800 [Candidatus Entotheonella factor]
MLASRELFMTSEIVTTPGPSGAYDITIVVSESGWLDMSRCVMLAASTSVLPDQTRVDLLSVTRVDSMLVNNSEELIRGQGRVGAPAGVFSPFRQYLPIRLGKWWLEGGNSINIRLSVDVSVEGVTFQGAFGAACPFQPDNERLYEVPEAVREGTYTYLASPAVAIAGSSSADLIITCDQNGIVDLRSLQILASRDPVANYDQDIVSVAAIESILPPDGQQLILGGTDAARQQLRAAPAATFGHLGRRFNWLDFGCLTVATNNQIVVRVRNLTNITAPGTTSEGLYSVGVRFYPGNHKQLRQPPGESAMTTAYQPVLSHVQR